MKLILLICILYGSHQEVSTSMFRPGFPLYGSLDNLGAQIQTNVDKQLQYLNSQLAGLNIPYTGANSALVNNNKYWNNFGAQIQNNVQNHVNQVLNKVNSKVNDINKRQKAFSAILSMVHGVGGTTVISYNGQNVLVKNYQITKCNGKIITNTNGFECSGESVPLIDDICVPGSNSISRINDVFCVPNKNFITLQTTSISIINGHIICENGVLLTKDALEKKCGPGVLSEKYAQIYYVPNIRNPIHIPIPSNNPYMPCKNKFSNICQFETDFSGFMNVFKQYTFKN